MTINLLLVVIFVILLGIRPVFLLGTRPNIVVRNRIFLLLGVGHVVLLFVVVTIILL